MSDLENVTYRRLAVLLILVGLLFAADSIFGFPVLYKLWPVLVLNLGAGFVGIFFRRTDRGLLYLAVGEYLVLFSAMAFYCNFTSWHELTWLWPAFIAFLGIVLVTLFFFQSEKRRLLVLGLLLMSLALFFFLVFSVSGRYWWTVFILAGFSLLLLGKKK
ncbi:MAG: hypothetical protein JW909_02585 [Planctomycetes bacterium]|nr:hypothetical protein [Planctomycetota bacterium]